METAKTSLWLYRFTLVLASPLLVLIMLREAWRRRGDKRFLKQRFGFAYKRHKDRPIWIHAASVGEINAALPLIKLIICKYKNIKPVITTNTVTAADVAHNKLGDSISHYYLPLDYRFSVQRFLRHINPACALIMETELWPTLFSQCRLQSIPICIINGRLSNKSLNGPWFSRQLLRFCLQNVQQVLARSQTDADAFITLGAPAEKVSTVGNIKFSALQGIKKEDQHRIIDRPYILAASTHADEEYQIAKLWPDAKAHKEHLLVIAPRHPERRAAILKQLQELSLNVAIRSRNDPIDDNTEVYLADTIGELFPLMAYAEFVFVGGSFVPHGGQNVLEPAILGKAIITGPHTFNFAAEIDSLLAHHAIIQLQSIQQLAKTMDELIDTPEHKQQLELNAQDFMSSNQNIAETYLSLLEQLDIISRPRAHTRSSTN